ncbi:energy transducer TonB [Sphingomonas pruni]|uniref:energy transducer TonB n=1 Tax=Sphingomonas pruni TaxID=40683 RepID=UPI0009FBF1CD|nr:energy transducer TonB [Sphingomonas pruni]
MTATITPERLKGLIGAALVQAAILYLLVAGLVVNLPTIGAVKNDLLAFVPPPPPPEIKIETQPKPSHKTEGKAAPPNIKSKATEVTAPPVPTPPVPPPPLPAAEKPFQGNQSTQGAAPVAGPGTGAGGIGNGTGSGGAGDGDGDGYGNDTEPRLKSGRMRRGDVPDAIWDQIDREATVGVRYFVNVDGSVSGCRVTRSSGIVALDGLTCRLMEQRYRYKPSYDEDGRPVRSIVYHNFTWEAPPEERRDRDDRDDR